MSLVARSGEHVVVNLGALASWIASIVPYVGPERRRRTEGEEHMSEEERPTRSGSGIVVARFQAAVIWSAAVAIVGAIISFSAYRIIEGYDTTNESQDKRITAVEQNLSGYKLEREIVTEALRERLTRLEERQAAYEERIVELRQGQVDILNEIRRLEHR